MDLTGMALLGGGLLAGMFAVSHLAKRNAHAWSPAFVIPLAIAIVALWMFFRHINRSAYPFIAPRLISGAGFGTVNLINGLYGGITAGVVALIPLYASNRYGIDALDSSTLLIAQGAAAILLSFAAAFALPAHRLPATDVCRRSRQSRSECCCLPSSPDRRHPAVCVAGRLRFLVGAGRGANNPASRNAGTATGAPTLPRPLRRCGR